MTKNRKDFLRELLIGVYKTDRLNFDDVEVSIKGRSIFDNCDLSNNKSRGHSYERYEQLFNATFNKFQITWCLDTDGNGYNPTKATDKIITQTQFSVSAAIDNSFAYLKSIGVNFDILCKDKPQEIEGIGAILYHILYQLLHMVFFDLINGEIITEEDDISSLLRSYVSKANFWIIRKAYEMNGTVNATTENSIVEFGNDKRNCNRFLYVKCNELGIHNSVHICASSIKSTILVKKEIDSGIIKKNSLVYEELLSSLGSYFPNDNKVYRLNYRPYTSNQSYELINFPEEHYISNISPDSNRIDEFGIYYLFNLDKNKLSVFYPDVVTPLELRSAIIKKAHNDLIVPFKERIAAYMDDILSYIEDVISRILLVDLEKLIACDIDAKTASIFNICLDDMMAFYKNYNAIDEADLYLYMMIDGALLDFYKQLNYNLASLVSSILEYVEHKRIKGHLEKLNTFVSSDSIAKAIALQAKDQSENASAYRMSTDRVTEDELYVQAYKKKTPGLFKAISNTVTSYYLLLKEGIE